MQWQKPFQMYEHGVDAVDAVDDFDDADDVDEPWYSWRALASQGDEQEDENAFDTFDHRVYLDVKTVYAGFEWGTKSPGEWLDLEAMKVHPACLSGLVALTRDESKLSLSLGAPMDNLKVRVCTLSGRLVREMDFVSSILGSNVKLFDVGWVGDDCLVLASPSGLVHAHHLGHCSYTPLSMGAACEREGLAEMRTSSAGIFFRTKANRFGAVLVADSSNSGKGDRTQFQGPVDLDMDILAKTTKLAGKGSSKSSVPDPPIVHCFEVVQLSHSSVSTELPHAVELVVAVDSDLIRVDGRGCFRLCASLGPFTRVCPSPNGLRVAALVGSTDFIIVADMSGALKARIDLAPHGVSAMDLRHMAWCGSDAVVACFEGCEDMLVAPVDGPSDSSAPASEVTPTWVNVGIVLAMSSEVDGVHILGRDRVQLCRLVPDAVKRVLGPGSTSPGALLLDSRDSMGREDLRAAADLLDVIDQLAVRQAAADCLEAAGWYSTGGARALPPGHIGHQERLLRAGIYGEVFGKIEKTSNRGYRATDVTSLGRALRIMNALHEPDVGMPLTLVQYGVLGLGAVIDRLCRMGHFLLALRICESMEHEHGRERVLLNWAKRKISLAPVSTEDEELLRELRAAFEQTSGGKNNSKNSSKDLRKNVQVPAVTVSWSAIAEHALECGRPQLAATLIEMEPSLKNQVSILLRLGRNEAAMKKAKADGDGDSVYAVLRDRDVRDGIVDHDPAEVMHAHYASMLAANPSNGSAVSYLSSPPLSASSSAPTTPSALLGVSTKDKFLSSARAAAERLDQLQKKIESKSGRQGFVGLSVVETMKRCHDYGLDSDVARLVKEFKVSERQSALVELDCLAARRDWVAMGRMATKLQSKSTGIVIGTRRQTVVATSEILELAAAAGASESDLLKIGG